MASLFLASPSEAAIIATKKKSSPRPGITLFEGTTVAPSSRYYAAKVDLCYAGVRVKATAPPKSFRTVPSFAIAAGADIAVNGDFFLPGPQVLGMAVGNAKLWPIKSMGIDPALSDEPFYERFGWIAFGPNFVEFTHTKYVKKHRAQFNNAKEGFSPTKVSHDIPKGTVALVSGFPELVTEGKRYTCANPAADTCFPDRRDMRARHPRTAMGISKNRRSFIVAVVDGRSAKSAGMYGTELAQLMAELGAWQAFNIDGGGSSEMWVRGRGTINKPSDGRSRPVANHWGIIGGDGKGKAAHCIPLPAPDLGTDGGAPDSEEPTSPDEPESDVPEEEDGEPETPDGSVTPLSPDSSADEDDNVASGCSSSPRTTGAPAIAVGGVIAFVLVATRLRKPNVRRRR